MRTVLFFFISLFSFCFSSLQAQKTIGIFTFVQEGVSAWDPDRIQSGISGSEEAVIYMSEQLVKLGYKVIVFGNPPKDSRYSFESCNPRYVSWDIELPSKLDIGIVWRMAQAGKDLKKFADKLYFWPHDTVDTMNLTSEQILVYDDVLWLSSWQKDSWAAKYPEFRKYNHVFGNGIEPSQFPPVISKKNPYSCIYASNYGRGLDQLLEIWPQIKEKFPEATLDIYYGWKHWGLLSPEKEEELRGLVKRLETLGVSEHGMVGHKELAQAFQAASLWTYPCTCAETFCITALKAQLAGAIPVICRHSGLVETCPNGFYCADTENYFSLLLQAMQQVEKISLEQRKMIGEFVLQKFTWEKIAHKWKDLFESSSKKKICLAMVVKNHKETIDKCLNSIKDKIDYWVLIGDQSIDGTIDLAKAILSKVPGEFYESHSSNPHQEVFNLAKEKAEYLLIVDPQEELYFSPNFQFPILDQDYYCDYTKHKELLIKSSLPWKWSEVLQKKLTCVEAKTFKVIPGVISSFKVNDSQSLSLIFAESYMEVKEYSRARDLLDKMLQSNPKDSSYSALYYRGMLGELLEESTELILRNYSRAYELSPRAEPLFRMSVFTFTKGQYALAYALAKQAAEIRRPYDAHEDWIYDYGVFFNLGNCASHIKKYEEAKAAYEKALSFPQIPENARDEILGNLQQIKNLF